MRYTKIQLAIALISMNNIHIVESNDAAVLGCIGWTIE
jgi:hypothetical protein